MSELPPLRIRMMKPTRLTLDVEDVNGKFTRAFDLAFDFNAQCAVEFQTRLSMLEPEIWDGASPINLSIMLQAAILMYHPEYAGPEGLRALRSYMDAGNAGQINDALNEAFVASLAPEKQEKIRAKQAAAKAKNENPTEPASATPAPEKAEPAAA